MLKAYLANRASPQESFIEFARRHDIDVLKAFAAEAARASHLGRQSRLFCLRTRRSRPSNVRG
jgi:hypothetical protein